MTTRVPNASIRRNGLVMLTACIATILALPVQAGITIPEVPLQSGTVVPPNILFILDDSGSMATASMPEVVPSLAPRNDRMIAYTRNTLFYNPNLTYRPWRNADGSFQADAAYGSAYSSTTLASGATINLGANDQHFLIPKDDADNLADTGDYWRYTLESDGTATKSELTFTTTWDWRNPVAITGFTWGAITRDITQERANYANWYAYHRTRAKVAKAGSSYAFTDLGENVRVGFTTIHQRSPFLIPVTQDQGLFRDNGGGFSYTNRTTWFDRLFNATASDVTPLPTALNRAGVYFSDPAATGPWGPSSAAGQLTCRQNFAILTTDGYWNSGTGPAAAEGDGAAGPLHTSTTGATYQYTPAPPYSDAWTSTLADVAMRYWKNDLRTDMVNNVPTAPANPAFWQHMVTFGISIGLQGTLNPNTALVRPGPNNDLTDGGLTWPNPMDTEDDDRIDDLFHASVNGRGAFVAATNPDQFTRGLRAALATIVERTASSSNVSANSTSLNAGTRLYQASYIGGRWIGELSAYPVTAGGVGATPAWRGSTGIPAVGRSVLTWNGSAGAAFPTAAQVTVLGAAGAAYIAGARSGEQQNGGVLRDRPHLLGDIVNSSPVFVKDTGTVYVGANDGLLHAFDGEGVGAGEEIFAYVPGNLNLLNLKELPNLDYPHHYFVDGPIVVSTRVQTTSKNLLVGALGRGGKGVFSLDVTNPGTFSTSDVEWDFDATDHDLMGNVLGRPVIAKLNNGDTGVIVANGPNSTNDTAVLYVLDITNGDVLAEINTGIGSAATPNGLMTPRGWDSDGNGTLDYVYAGDLLGNMWKFDLSASNTNTWDDAGSRLLMFTATDGVKPQPITGSPTLAIDPVTYKTWVFFGTGRFLNQSDLTNPDGSKNVDVQTWYGLQDSTTLILRSQLQQRSIVTSGSINGRPVRAFTAHTTLDPARKGWYIDLKTPPSATAEGERMIGDSAVIGTTLLSASIIPNSDACEFGGRGFINALDAFTGSSVATPFFDIDGDGVFTDDVLPSGGVDIGVGSVDLGIAMPTTPTLIENLLVAGGSLGTTGSVGVNNPANQGRISWREVVGD